MSGEDRQADERPKETPEGILQFFAFDHLPDELRHVSMLFTPLAYAIAQLPRNPERTTALRKLLEAKDAAVRAVIYKGG